GAAYWEDLRAPPPGGSGLPGWCRQPCRFPVFPLSGTGVRLRRAAVLYEIDKASSLARNLNRQRWQILAHPGTGAHREHDKEEAMNGIGPRRQLARGRPVGGEFRCLPRRQRLVAEGHALDGGDRLRPDLLMLAVLGPDVKRLDTTNLVVDRPRHGQGEMDAGAGGQPGRG